MNSKIIIGIGALVAMAGGGCGYYWFHRSTPKAHAAAIKHPEPPPKLAYVDAKELTLRLADTDAEHYIKLTPVLGVRAKSADEVTDRVAVVRDRIVAIVTAHRSAELTTPEGEARLKHDLTLALRKDFNDEIVDLYFSGYLVE